MTNKSFFILALTVGFISWMAGTLSATSINFYTNNFEQYPIGTPLVDTNYWFSSSWTDTGGVTVVASVSNEVFAPGSTKAAMIPVDITLSNRFSTSAKSSHILVRMQPRVVHYNGNYTPASDTNSTAMFYVDTNGHFVVCNGTNWEAITTILESGDPYEVVENCFTNIDLYLDYTSKKWRLDLNLETITNNIGFVNSNMSSFAGFDLYNGNSDTSYLDHVAVYGTYLTMSVYPPGLTNYNVRLANATDQVFEVRSSGNGYPGEMSYSITTNAPLDPDDPAPAWLVITNNATGVLTNDATNTVCVHYETAGLAGGNYSATFTIHSTNAQYYGQTQTVDVLVRVGGMGVTPTNFAISKMFGYAAGTTNFNVTHTLDGEMAYWMATNPAGARWLTVTDGSSGTLTNDATNSATITYSTNDLTPGIVTARVEVITVGDTQCVQTVMTTYSRPLLAITPEYSQTIHKGQQPANTTLYLSNSGAYPRPRVNYTATSDVPWLLVNTNGTILDAESRAIGFSFSDMTATSGLFTGHVTITGTDAGSGYTPTGMVSVVTQVTVQVNIIAPGMPAGLSVSRGTYTDSARLTWNSTTNVDHYEIWNGTNSSVINATCLASSSTNSYTDSAIMPGIITYYWVRTINAYGGAGDYSASDFGWRYLMGPAGISASDGLYTNKVAISWTGVYGATSYQILRNTLALTNSATLVQTVSASVSSYDDTSPAVDTEYYYWIKSCTPDMGTISSDSDVGYRSALMQPAGLIASKGSYSDKVRLVWQTVAGASRYQVWRNSDDDRSGATQIGEATVSGYDDTSVAHGSYFYYWIRAHGSLGYSRYSDSDSGFRQLAPPTGVAASDGTYPYRVRVSWEAAENATSYEVWRGEGTGVGPAAESSMKLGEAVALYYDDHAVVASMPYYYRVKAVNSLSSSDFSSSDTGSRAIAPATTTKTVKNDYDGDHLSDLVLYTSTSGVWKILYSTYGLKELSLGIALQDAGGVPGDYDGDGIADPMMYWPANGIWLVSLSSIGYSPLLMGRFGGGNSSQAVADYDGDALTDVAVYNESAGILPVLLSNGGYFNIAVNVVIGGTGWWPCPADYDGDARCDPAVYSANAGRLMVYLSASGYPAVYVALGGVGITVHPADYDGDAKADLAAYEESTGRWTVSLSTLGYFAVSAVMGGVGYAPIVADYDGDSLTDPAVYSESGNWLIMFSASGYAIVSDPFGGTNCVPVGR